MQIGSRPPRCFSSWARKRTERVRKPLAAGARTRAAQHGAFERSDGAFAMPAPRRSSGCLSSASNVTGASLPSAASAASRANIPAGVSASASPPESSAAMFQRASAAFTRRPSARSGVTSAAVLPSLHRFAQRDRDRERFLLGVGGFDHADVFQRGVGVRAERGIGRVPLPQLGRGRRPQRFRQQAARGRSRLPASRPLRARSRCGRAAPACANCGWPGAGAIPLPSSPAISRHDSSSRSVSRPGSTTAPCGSRAMVAINSAVAGIEPVEPAAITGPSVLRASRAVSALISASRRSAGFDATAFVQGSLGHASRAICRNFSVSCQYRSNMSGTRPSSRSHDTPRVVMSSISRARSSASAQAAAGVCATSGAAARAVQFGRRSPIWRPAAPAAAGVRGRRAPAAKRARPPRCRPLRLRQTRSRPRRYRRSRRCAAGSRRRSLSTSRNASRISRQARRVGR